MKAIFWDFGDVLVFYDHMRGCKALSAFTTKSTEEIYALIFGNQLEEQHYNRGEYSDLEWYDLCVQALDLEHCSYETFAEAWGDIFSPNPAITQALDVVRPEIQQFVLSNTNGLHFAWARDNLPVLMSHFSRPEQVILSSEEKSRKPEPLIFERALARCGFEPADCVFIDDKEVNVEAFKNMGGNGIVYNARSTPIDELMQQLASKSCLA